MKRYTFSLFFLVALILGLSFEPIAQAIPTSQRDCDTNVVSTSSTSYVNVPDSVVTVNNGDSSRNCIFTFSAEAVTLFPSGRIDIGYTVSGTNENHICRAVGPQSLHRGNTLETHTNVSVESLLSGTYTIRPCFKVNSGSGFLGRRCLIVECRTQ
jgi:hypothetical protein